MPDKPKKFHFFVNTEKVYTEETQLTGAQIKQLAGVPTTDLLELKNDKDEPVVINDDQLVEIKNGMHFRTHPGGQDS